MTTKAKNESQAAIPRINLNDVLLPTAKIAWRFKTNYNANEFRKSYEVNNAPSETVPDQTMTIAQIVERYARGLSYQDYKTPIFDGEDDILEGVDFKSLDLSEKHDFVDSRRQELRDLTEEITSKSKKQVSKETEKPPTQEGKSPDAVPSPSTS